VAEVQLLQDRTEGRGVMPEAEMLQIPQQSRGSAVKIPAANSANKPATILHSGMLRFPQQFGRNVAEIATILPPRPVLDKQRQSSYTDKRLRLTPGREPLRDSKNKNRCWHCRDGRCACIVCAPRHPPGEAGACVVCGGDGIASKFWTGSGAGEGAATATELGAVGLEVHVSRLP
jgi:hypothetical protein